jgi:MoxR-like ATPase
MEEQNIFQNRTDLNELLATIDKVRDSISNVIIGQRKMIDFLLTAILSDGHVLIEGVPGIAKTLTAKLIAKSISANFSRIQFTPDLMPSDILGTSVFNLTKSEFEFNKGPIFSNIILIDEINRAPAKTQSALFEVMEERQITIDGHQFVMQRPFIVFATQNPIEHEGTYQLPEAQLDRFLFKIEVGYPALDEEIKILTNHHESRNEDLSKIEAILSPEQIALFQKLARSIHIEENLLKYIAQIVGRTRNNNAIYLGASPRASLAIMNAAKSFAAINGRDFVSPDDIREVCYPVLRHRIILTPEKELEGSTPDKIIREILDTVEVPK